MPHEIPPFLFLRLQPGFQHVKLPGSGRSAFIIKDQGDDVTIGVNQLSDLLAFQREIIVKCSKVGVIKVMLGTLFTSLIDGSPEPEPPEVWQTALHHLLNTYKPAYCYIYTGGTKTGLGMDSPIEVQAQGCYRGYWDGSHNELSIIRCVCSTVETVFVCILVTLLHYTFAISFGQFEKKEAIDKS